MRILVTNDDGIHAPGLKVLQDIARKFSDDVWTVAPDVERSGAGRSLTLSQPLRLRETGQRQFECSGTPADCVVMATRKIMPEMPDLILSGVNRGQNLADDITYSGTIGAAMEGTALGIKSIAFSQVLGMYDKANSFAVSAWHGEAVVSKLLDIDFGVDCLMNVNFPNCRPEEVSEIVFTSQGKREQNYLIVDERLDNRGEKYFWFNFKRELGRIDTIADLAAAFNKKISVTPIALNLTHLSQLNQLRQ